MAAPARGGIGLFKRGWHEIPEIIGSTFMAFLGVGMIGTAYTIYVNKDGDNRKYKMSYTVLRHDDPKAARVRTGING